MDHVNNQIVESRPLREQVADIVRGMILRGELKSGDQLSERAISQNLQVSTTPVKEAFRLLQAEGLIYTKPRSGSYVADFTIDDMLKVGFMRSAMEGVAAYYAAENLQAADFERMHYVLDQVEPLLSNCEENAEAFYRYNLEFHQIIRQASGSSFLSRQIETLRTIDGNFRQVSQIAYFEEPVSAYREHRQILAALEARDSHLSEQLIVEHHRKVYEKLTSHAKELLYNKASSN